MSILARKALPCILYPSRMHHNFMKFSASKMAWLMLCMLPFLSTAQVSTHNSGDRHYNALRPAALLSALDSAVERMTVPFGSALNSQDTARFATDVQFGSRVVQGSLAVGEDAELPAGMLGNDYFGFATVLIESNAPSMALVDSSEVDQSWYHWRWATGHPHNDTLEAFVLEQGTSGQIPIFLEAGAGNRSLWTRADGVVELATGLQLNASETAITGTPDTTGLAQGSLTYWGDSQLITLPGGAHGQTLNWCSGRPTWGPCPAPESLAWGALNASSPDPGAFTLSAAIDTWGTAEVLGIYLLVSNDALPANVDTIPVEWTDGTPVVSENYLTDAPGANHTFRFAAASRSGWINSADASASTATSTFTCGENVQVDGTPYATVEWADRCWFQDYLNTTTYSDGTPLNQWNNALEWDNGAALPAYAQTDFTASVDASHPLQYNFAAIADAEAHLGLCPVGWRIAEISDWEAALSAGLIGTDGMLNVVNTSYYTGTSWSILYPQTLGAFNPYTFVWTPWGIDAYDPVKGPGLTPQAPPNVANLTRNMTQKVTLSNKTSAPIRCVQ